MFLDVLGLIWLDVLGCVGYLLGGLKHLWFFHGWTGGWGAQSSHSFDYFEEMLKLNTTRPICSKTQDDQPYSFGGSIGTRVGKCPMLRGFWINITCINGSVMFIYGTVLHQYNPSLYIYIIYILYYIYYIYILYIYNYIIIYYVYIIYEYIHILYMYPHIPHIISVG